MAVRYESSGQTIRDFLAGLEVNMLDLWCTFQGQYHKRLDSDKNDLPEINEETWQKLFDIVSSFNSCCGSIYLPVHLKNGQVHAETILNYLSNNHVDAQYLQQSVRYFLEGPGKKQDLPGLSEKHWEKIEKVLTDAL